MVEITCSKCGNKQDFEVPEGVCVLFTQCSGCKENIDVKDLCKH